MYQREALNGLYLCQTLQSRRRCLSLDRGLETFRLALAVTEACWEMMEAGGTNGAWQALMGVLVQRNRFPPSLRRRRD